MRKLPNLSIPLAIKLRESARLPGRSLIMLSNGDECIVCSYKLVIARWTAADEVWLVLSPSGQTLSLYGSATTRRHAYALGHACLGSSLNYNYVRKFPAGPCSRLAWNKGFRYVSESGDFDPNNVVSPEVELQAEALRTGRIPA